MAKNKIVTVEEHEPDVFDIPVTGDEKLLEPYRVEVMGEMKHCYDAPTAPSILVKTFQMNDVLTVDAEQVVNGVVWLRVGENRWVDNTRTRPVLS